MAGNLTRNAANVQRISRAGAAQLPAGRSAATCGCDHALANAIITDPAHITPELHEKYELLLGKYL